MIMKFGDKELPFESCFAGITIKPIVSSEKDKYLALASLDEVKKFIPNIDTAKNADLLPVAFDACVVNRANKNGDIIDTETALAMYKQFTYKPINVEHNRQKVIGMILAPGFSEFGTSKPLTEAEAAKMTKPFNITLGGVIWRIVAPELADLIEEASDPSSPKHLSVSASWELGFSSYRIALMEAGKKNFTDAKKIISDSKEIAKCQAKLIALGGDGKIDDLFAFRIPSGEVLPLGIGFTERPAAEVKGIATEQSTPKVGQTTEPAIGKPSESSIETNKNNFEETPQGDCEASQEEKQKIISHSPNPNVNEERNIMKITSIKDLTDENLKQCSASAVSEFIATELKKGSDEWTKAQTTLNEQLTQAQAATKKAQDDFVALQTQMKEIQASLEKLQTEKAEAAKVEQFNVRMSEIATLFELTDEVRAAIVDDIKACASEEDFTKWKSKAQILLKGFAKSAKKEEGKDKKDEDKETPDDKKAKAHEAAASVVNNAVVESNTGLPNGSTATPPTLKEKYAQAFAKENFIIKK